MKGRKRKLWFRAKTLGWGWYPITWEGWLVTLIYSVVFAFSLIVFIGFAPAALQGGAAFLPGFLILFSWLMLLTASLLKICYMYGEPPRWRWGKE